MIQNIRDLGGIRTGKGGMIKHGCLVRSANLAQAEAQDLEGIATVIDLRTAGEREEKPDRICGRQYLALPVFEEITAGMNLRKMYTARILLTGNILKRRGMPWETII